MKISPIAYNRLGFEGAKVSVPWQLKSLYLESKSHGDGKQRRKKISRLLGIIQITSNIHSQASMREGQYLI